MGRTEYPQLAFWKNNVNANFNFLSSGKNYEKWYKRFSYESCNILLKKVNNIKVWLSFSDGSYNNIYELEQNTNSGTFTHQHVYTPTRTKMYLNNIQRRLASLWQLCGNQNRGHLFLMHYTYNEQLWHTQQPNILLKMTINYGDLQRGSLPTLWMKRSGCTKPGRKKHERLIDSCTLLAGIDRIYYNAVIELGT